MYHLLKRCAEISAGTEGAFDITLGPLIKAWGFHRGEGCVPSDEEIERIMEKIGIDRVQFDDDDNLVHFTVPGLEINLGAVGKGHAIDQAVETLKIYGVANAVIHGGQSTIYAMGEPPEAEVITDQLSLISEGTKGEKGRRGEGKTGAGEPAPVGAPDMDAFSPSPCLLFSPSVLIASAPRRSRILATLRSALRWQRRE